MNLGIGDIVPEALHRKVGWDIRHHFMAEKIVDRFGLVLPRDRELVRQLAVVYVLGGMTAPPLREPEHAHASSKTRITSQSATEASETRARQWPSAAAGKACVLGLRQPAIDQRNP